METVLTKEQFLYGLKSLARKMHRDKHSRNYLELHDLIFVASIQREPHNLSEIAYNEGMVQFIHSFLLNDCANAIEGVLKAEDTLSEFGPDVIRKVVGCGFAYLERFYVPQIVGIRPIRERADEALEEVLNEIASRVIWK